MIKNILKFHKENKKRTGNIFPSLLSTLKNYEMVAVNVLPVMLVL